MTSDIDVLSQIVQRNCHISDAQHARSYTLCIYLLKMREYFRWERDYPQTAPLPKADLGEWVVARERLWEGLEPEEFDCVPLGELCHDPFDSETINQELIPKGLVYSAGYGRFVKPHFFLGTLERHEKRDGIRVLVSAREYARDMSAPPAMLLGDTIFVRRDALRRVLWEKYEEWKWRKQPLDAMARAVSGYGFDEAPAEALEAMTEQELETVILHELGELRAGQRVGDGWNRMLARLACSRGELHARAVRDLLADCLVTLPELIQKGREASLHLYFANFSGMRRELFPRLVTAYDAWLRDGNRGPLRDALSEGRTHWEATGVHIMHLFANGAATTQDAIPRYVEDHRCV